MSLIRWSMKSRVLLLLLVASAAARGAQAETILFIGNSFTFAAYSPVWKYRAASVQDLNRGGVGGVPALFKLFSQEAGLNYDVSLETAPGKDLAFHLEQKRSLVARAWDHVILQSYSTLDERRPGDPSSLTQSATALASVLRAQNPNVDIRLMSTWSRADLTYMPGKHWFGQPITAMADDVRAGYDRAAQASGAKSVIGVGQAWNRAYAVGFADPNPYDGVDPGKVDLWTFDNYHASTYGYYLEALMVFGAVTGRDPASLGPAETAASELGVSQAQAMAMQAIARDELVAEGYPLAPARVSAPSAH